MTADSLNRIRAHHARTKHHPHRFAAGPGYMDWENQPDPFRSFAGAPTFPLPLVADRLTRPAAALRHPMEGSDYPLDRDGLAALLELSLGLSAWKSYQGERWALRCNPSSGNLHPTEGYLLLPEVGGMTTGVYHYASRDHRLEQRCTLKNGALPLPPGSILFALSALHQRESWKYGERSYRYCQLNAGHALATARYAAAALGWPLYLVPTVGDDDLARWLGLDPREEHPELLMVTGPGAVAGMPLQAILEGDPGQGAWQGDPSPLSPEPLRDWAEVEAGFQATHHGPLPTLMPWIPPPHPRSHAPPTLLSAADLIRHRRSAQRYDPKGTLSRQGFARILDTLLPRPDTPPWDAWPWRPATHLVVMVHRVTGVTPGIYFLARDREALPRLQRDLSSRLAWRPVPDLPEHLPLFLLEEGDVRQLAGGLACGQEIGADGVLAVGMLSAFDAILEGEGAWAYRRLHWESGMVGQALYLAAEAEGMAGTGIGCFFDDPFHQRLGITDTRWQTLYHFAMGHPLKDNRLEDHPPYAHLDR